MIPKVAIIAAWHLLYLVTLALALVLGYGAFRKLGMPRAEEWCKEVFRALSHLIAAALTGSSRHSLSAQCGARGRTSFRWAIVAGLIDGVLGYGHCEKAARGEGLIS